MARQSLTEIMKFLEIGKSSKFGILKMSWESYLSYGFRREKSNLQTIFFELTALTNYLIDQHPITSDDAPEPSEITNDDEVKDDHEEASSKVIAIAVIAGICNQELTSHLNSVLQVLASILEFASFVQQNANNNCRLIKATQ